MDSTIRVGIADNHPFVRASLHSTLQLKPRIIRVVAVAENGLEAIAMVEQHRPDVVLMVISMPVMNGIDETRMITSKFPNTKVIVLNLDTDHNYSDSAYAAGASDFLIQGCHIDEILNAINECCIES